MTNDLNNILVEKIKCHIPKNVKPLPFLMNLLGLSKESVYRRLRGEIHFTFDEACELSNRLGFSIDEILANDTGDRVFFNLQVDHTLPSSVAFFRMLKQYLSQLEQMAVCENKEVIYSRNRLSVIHSIGCDCLFKFMYYKWTHQMNDVPSNYSLSDVVLPNEIVETCNLIKEVKKNLANITYIIDQSILLRTIGEIQYYCRRKLISEMELSLIHDELLRVVAACEKQAIEGCDEAGVKMTYYLSTFDIESNIDYACYDDECISYNWVHAINPLIISSPKLCLFQKKWLESIRKYSVLITQSNELVQSEFFNKQRSYIENMSNVVYWNESLFCL